MDKQIHFIMYLDYEEHFSLLTDEEIGVLMRGIFQYIRTGKIPDFNSGGAVKMAFSFIKTNIDIDNRKYRQKCEKNKQIAEERWKKQRESQEKQQFKGCHLGSSFKNESCYKCQKKKICPLQESPDFKLSHSNKSFEEWCVEKDGLYSKWCADRANRGLSTDIELFDYNWLDDNE